jgi:hypothetical protein
MLFIKTTRLRRKKSLRRLSRALLRLRIVFLRLRRVLLRLRRVLLRKVIKMKIAQTNRMNQTLKVQ